ncbi:family 61 glycoside hydrolase [Diaporthe sp. PMI_573]|nr:family 61 glycoside hydrolase [Diaporthaceae sp. PMI_573]
MPSLKLVAATLCGFATTALAHGLVSGFVTDGKWNQGYLLDYYYLVKNGGTMPAIAGWYEEALDLGFVEPNNFGTQDINCHKNSAPGSIAGTVSAGGTIQFQWTTWPHGLGPMLTYIAPYSGSPSSIDKSKLLWTKIDEAGINYNTQVWAAQDMINNNNTWTITVPKTLKAGSYVFRHETIAAHGAGSANGAQAYPFCINIQVTGSGTKVPSGGTLGVNLYKATDPGILFNPYTTITSYKIPGPALWTG